MNGWRPIETAPKDATWILLCGGSVDYFDDYAHGPIPEPSAVVARWIEDNRQHYTTHEWGIALWDGDWRTTYAAPTNWMPLPEPPQ